MSWKRFFRREQWDRERASELEAYLQLETDENIARGMPPGEARFAAIRKLGNATLVREEIYRMNSVNWAETLWQDIRHAARLLRINPGFAAVAIVSLALGIGANTAIFQLLDAVRLRSLPVKNPQELVNVRVQSQHGRTGSFQGNYPQITNPQWEQVRAHQQVFSSIFAWSETMFDLSSGGEAYYARGLWVSGDFFDTLGVAPVSGRLLNQEDDQRGCGSPGAVISYAFWQRQYAANPAAIGSRLTLDGHSFEVIGVTPPSFFGFDVGRSFDVAIPICAESLLMGKDSRLDKRANWWLAVIGRLKPGVSLEQANAQLKAISKPIFEATLPTDLTVEATKAYLEFTLQARPAANGFSDLREAYENPLWLLISIAGIVLIIACANLANLLLARATAREREIAVRMALGASRWRLARQLLAESLLLAAIGAVIAVLLEQGLARALVSFLTTERNKVFLDLHLDWHVLAFTTALAALTIVLFGLIPAVRATRIAPVEAMKAGSRGITSGRSRFRLQRALVSSQVALSLVLLFSALLFVRTFRNLTHLNIGFRDEGVLLVELDLRRAGIPEGQAAATDNELLEKLRVTAGVAAAAQAEGAPMSGSWSNNNVRSDEPGAEAKDWTLTNVTWASPGFLNTVGMPLLAGRDFGTADTKSSPKVAIINELFAEKLFSGQNPLGKRFHFEPDTGKTAPIYEVVGLVKNAKHTSLRAELQPLALLVMTQVEEGDQDATFVVRSGLPLRDLTARIQQSITEVNSGISIHYDVLKTRIRESLLGEQLTATLSGFFGLLAGLLAVIGLYGVISYMTTRRRNEIGIRMALGAGRGDVVRMILRQAAVLVGVGLAAGTLLAIFAAKAANSLLYGLRPSDPATFLMSIGALAVVAAAASFLPARRASRLDPMAALRDE